MHNALQCTTPSELGEVKASKMTMLAFANVYLIHLYVLVTVPPGWRPGGGDGGQLGHIPTAEYLGPVETVRSNRRLITCDACIFEEILVNHELTIP